jgi:hypothetical protein
VRLDAQGHIIGYLNLTPRQGDEQLATFPTFRVAHNRQEGDRLVTPLAKATGLPFHTGRGSCVEDVYSTQVRARYLEIACLVSGPRTASVIVGAAPPQAWGAEEALIQRAIAAVTS